MNLQKYSQLPQCMTAPTGQLNPHSAQMMYHQALTTAQRRVSNAWEPSTILRQDKTLQELSQWLSRLPPGWGKTLVTCTPADLIAFVESHWLAAHAGTTVADGSIISSPSGVNQCLSRLSTGFNLIGRVNSWTPEAPSGNPVQSSLVASWRKGYKLQAWRLGYLEGSAVPISEGKLHQLVDYLDQLLSRQPPTMTRLLLERDALSALLMWETSLRGINCGGITLSDFSLPEGQALRLPLADPLPGGSMLILKPNGTKTVKGRRSGPFNLVVGTDPCHSFLGRLPAFLKHRLANGVSEQTCFFSPLTSDRRAFKDSGSSASDIGKRMRHHLEQAGLYAGESNHGFRRGSMQALAAAGMASADMGQKVQINTAITVAKNLDLTRHEPRLDRHNRLHASI